MAKQSDKAKQFDMTKQSDKEIQCETPKKSKYTKGEKKQIIFIILAMLVYTASYVSRYSYNSNIVLLRAEYGLTNAETGLVGTFYFFAYGIGQVIHGLLCKKYNKKIIIPLVLFISAAINIAIFFKPPFFVYKYLWFLNGISLSVLWSSLVLLLSDTLDEKFLNLSLTLMCFPVPLGTCITYGASALFNLFGNYTLSFLLGAAVPSIIALIWIFSFDGLTENAKIRAAKNAAAKTLGEAKNVGLSETALNAETLEKSQSKTKKSIGFSVIILFVVLGVFAVVTNLIKDGLNTWVPQILKDSYGFGDSLSIILTLVLPLLGMLGSVFAIFCNKIIKDYVLLCGVLFLFTALFVGLIIGSLEFNWTAVCVIVFFGLVSLLTHSVNAAITAIAPLQMRENLNSGAVAGILNGCAYVGSTISAYALGALADGRGWLAVFWLLFAVSAVSVVLALAYFSFKKIKKQK